MNLTITNPNSIPLAHIHNLIRKGLEAGTVVLTFGREKRSNEQNAKMWPMLTDIAAQVNWYDLPLTKEDWKDLATADFEGQRIIPALGGGFMSLGARTSKYNKAKMSEFIEYLYAFGAEKGVNWSDKSKAVIQGVKNDLSMEAQR